MPTGHAICDIGATLRGVRHVVDIEAPPVNSFERNGSKWLLIDFGREFQGGLRFHTAAGVAGTTVFLA